jgi:hypothetical protein
MMKRDQCLKLLAKYHRDEIVVPVYQATFEWLAIKPGAPSFTAVTAVARTDAKAIERILKAKFPRRTLESIRNERASKAL